MSRHSGRPPRVAELAVAAEAEVGEGPVFDPRSGALCWVDLSLGDLFQTDLVSKSTTRIRLATPLGAAVPRQHRPGFAVAVADGFGLVEDDELHIVDPVLPDSQMRMNDAKCDPAGRLWAGSTELGFAAGRGSLHRWDGRSPSERVVEGLTLPNGLGWNADATEMYLVDSMAGTIMSAPFDGVRGEVGRFQVIARVEQGLPDGLAVDVDGCIWVAVWGGSAVHRYSAAGQLVEEIPMPVTQPSSCAFADDGTLYVTSARSGLDRAALQDQPLAGSIFAIGTDTRGVPVAGFGA